MKLKFLIILLLASHTLLSAESKKITITGNDTMQFDLKSFEVNEGEKIELTFKNIGKVFNSISICYWCI